MYVLNDPKNFYLFFAPEYQKYAEFYAVQTRLKFRSENMICRKHLQVSTGRIDEDKLQFCTLFSPVIILSANFEPDVDCPYLVK